MVVLDEVGRVLVFERSDVLGAFQLPQGGMDDDEEPVDAMWRELEEETGLTGAHVAILGQVPEWLGYELPPSVRSKKVGRGQVHKWTFPSVWATDPTRSSVPGGGVISTIWPGRWPRFANRSIGVWLSSCGGTE